MKAFLATLLLGTLAFVPHYVLARNIDSPLHANATARQDDRADAIGVIRLAHDDDEDAARAGARDEDARRDCAGKTGHDRHECMEHAMRGRHHDEATAGKHDEDEDDEDDQHEEHEEHEHEGHHR